MKENRYQVPERLILTIEQEIVTHQTLVFTVVFVLQDQIQEFGWIEMIFIQVKLWKVEIFTPSSNGNRVVRVFILVVIAGLS